MRKDAIPLSPVQQKFILHWGEMGTRWGVNRTAAQIHALLYLSELPLRADQIAATLTVARSNVSTSLRELQSWGVVRVVHEMGDRRDHFESMKDVWEMFQVILDERKRREVDPTLQMLGECMAELGKRKKEDAYLRARIKALHGFIDEMSGLYTEMRGLPAGAVRNLVRLKGKVKRILGRASA